MTRSITTRRSRKTEDTNLGLSVSSPSSHPRLWCLDRYDTLKGTHEPARRQQFGNVCSSSYRAVLGDGMEASNGGQLRLMYRDASSSFFGKPSTMGTIDDRTLAGSRPTLSCRGRVESWDAKEGWGVEELREVSVDNGFSFPRAMQNPGRRSSIVEAAVIYQENKLRGGFFCAQVSASYCNVSWLCLTSWPSYRGQHLLVYLQTTQVLTSINHVSKTTFDKFLDLWE